MKTLFTIVLASLISFSSFASNENFTSIENEDLMSLSEVSTQFKHVNVLLKGGVGDIRIAIYNKEGKKLTQRKVKERADDVLVPYNLEDLPCGEYQVEITSADERVVYTVNTYNKAIPAAELPLMAYGKQIDDNTINISVIGLTEPGVEVKIKSESRNSVIHSEYISTPKGFRKDFSFNNMDLQDIYFELTDALGRTKTIHI